MILVPLKNTFAVLILILTAQFAFAETTEPTSNEVSRAPQNQASTNEDYEVVAKKKQIVEDSSELNRQNKNYQLNAILAGIGPSISSTAGVSFGYHLNPDQVILIEATAGSLTGSASASGSLSYITGSTLEIKTRSFGAHFKHYVTNSFYYRAGADYRTATYDYKYTSIFSSNTDTGSFKGSSLAANFQIGNQWQWENFTLGCDWVGYSLPVSSSVEDLTYTSSYDSAAQKKYTEDQADTLIKNPHLNLLRFYLGASF